MDSYFEKRDKPTVFIVLGKEVIVDNEQLAKALSRLQKFMETNPREQKMTTNVAKSINDSLLENLNFHELNRGILLSADRYVFMEIFTGLETTVELAAARNTSVQVDLKSIAELKDSFEVIN